MKTVIKKCKLVKGIVSPKRKVNTWDKNSKEHVSTACTTIKMNYVKLKESEQYYETMAAMPINCANCR